MLCVNAHATNGEADLPCGAKIPTVARIGPKRRVRQTPEGARRTAMHYVLKELHGLDALDLGNLLLEDALHAVGQRQL